MYTRFSKMFSRLVQPGSSFARNMSSTRFVLSQKSARRAVAVAGVTAAVSGSVYYAKQKSKEKVQVKSTRRTLAALKPITELYLSDTKETTSRWTPTIPKADLDGIGGNTEILNNVADIVQYLQNPEEYIKNGVKAPKGVILSGPPGVGKSFIAEAIAGHAGVPLIMISGPEVLSPFVGVAEENLREIFKQAKEAAPCVLCIDEIDAITGQRIDPPMRSTDMYYNSMVDQLLSLLAQENTGVIVVGTTNNFANMDSAIIRPGRFDRHITINLPNQEDRKAILKVHIGKKELDSSVSFEDLAALSAGFSGAKIASWVNEAALNATKEGSKVLTAQHFDRARNLLQSSLQRKQTDPIQKNRTALHESGHAIVAHVLGIKVHKVSTLISGKTFGSTEFLPTAETQNYSKQEALDLICTSLAGRAAEQLTNTLQFGSLSDIKIAKEIAIDITKEAMGTTLSNINVVNDVEDILQNQMKRATELLKTHEAEWKRVTDALVTHDELNRDQFLKVFEGRRVSFRPAADLSTKNTSHLPPKKAMRVKLFDANSKNNSSSKKDEEEPLPFTKEEVAKAFGLEPNLIRVIKYAYDEGYEILLVPSFTDHEKMEKLSDTLDKNNIEHLYFRKYLQNPEFKIRKLGAKDFIKFVKKMNEAPPATPSREDDKPANSRWF